jgi:hypothetical protein
MRLVSAFEIVNHTLVVGLILAVTGYSLQLWSQGQIGPGAVAAVTAMALRISGMSHWIMWEMASLFENIGTMQDGIGTLTRPRAVVDAPDAKPLQVPRGEVRFENVRFGYGKPTPVIDDFELTVKPGREGRPDRPLGRRQVDAGQPAAALLRPGRRPHPDRRPGHRARHAGQPARPHRHGDAGHVAAAPLGARQHPLRPADASEEEMVQAARAPRRTTSSSA